MTMPIPTGDGAVVVRAAEAGTTPPPASPYPRPPLAARAPARAPALAARAPGADPIGPPAFLYSRLPVDASDVHDAHLSTVWTTLAEGVDGAKPHHHAHRSELFYVIDGAIDVLAGEQVVR